MQVHAAKPMAMNLFIKVNWVFALMTTLKVSDIISKLVDNEPVAEKRIYKVS